MHEEWSFQCNIDPEFEGMRVDAVLAKLYPQYSRNQWIQWLKSGLIARGQQALSPKDKVKSYQLLVGKVMINVAQSTHEGQDIQLNIVYEDEHLMVIDKPKGLVVHPGAGQPSQTLLNALLYHNPELNTLARAGIVHRLDKDTTGLMVIAKTQETYLRLIDMMQKREINRRYLALVHGLVPCHGRIETFYGRHPQNRLKMAVRPQGKIAITHYKIHAKYHQNTLLEIQLETGRTHQIRVHLCHLGYPIVGDKLYGKTKAPGVGPITAALNDFPRQALHAFALEFIHPILHQPLTFTSVLPDDFSSLLKIL